MWLKITSKINANRPAKNKLINQKKSRLKAEGLLDVRQAWRAAPNWRTL